MYTPIFTHYIRSSLLGAPVKKKECIATHALPLHCCFACFGFLLSARVSSRPAPGRKSCIVCTIASPPLRAVLVVLLWYIVYHFSYHAGRKYRDRFGLHGCNPMLVLFSVQNGAKWRIRTGGRPRQQ